MPIIHVDYVKTTISVQAMGEHATCVLTAHHKRKPHELADINSQGQEKKRHAGILTTQGVAAPRVTKDENQKGIAGTCKLSWLEPRPPCAVLAVSYSRLPRSALAAPSLGVVKVAACYISSPTVVGLAQQPLLFIKKLLN